MKKLLELSLEYLPDQIFAKIILENIDEKSKNVLIKNIKSIMSNDELIKLNKIKSKKASKSNYKEKEYIV